MLVGLAPRSEFVLPITRIRRVAKPVCHVTLTTGRVRVAVATGRGCLTRPSNPFIDRAL